MAMTNPAHETALAAAVIAVARSMGADADTIRRLRDAARGKEPPETFLTTRQVCERLGLCQKSVLDMAEELGVVRHTCRLLRFPLSRVVAWEQGKKPVAAEA